MSLFVRSSPCQLIEVTSRNHWNAVGWAPAQDAGTQLSSPVQGSRGPRLHQCAWGCQLALPRDSSLHLSPDSPASTPSPFRGLVHREACTGQFSGEAKWACCPSVAKEEEWKIKCNRVQTITPLCMSPSISHWCSIICLSISGDPVDTRPTVGAQKGADKGSPPSRGS